MAALGSVRPGSDLAYNSIFARRPQKSSAKEGFALALLLAYGGKGGEGEEEVKKECCVGGCSCGESFSIWQRSAHKLCNFIAAKQLTADPSKVQKREWQGQEQGRGLTTETCFNL